MESAAAIATRCMTAVSMALPSAEAPLRLAQLPEELIVFVAAQLGGIDAMASFGRASRSCCEAVRKCRASLALFTSDWVWQSDVESPSESWSTVIPWFCSETSRCCACVPTTRPRFTTSPVG